MRSPKAGSSSSAEMRQKNAAANPFIARPAIYYGDGPFDPPSSDDEEEDQHSLRHSSEDLAESVLLLNVDKSGPSSPGRAERGDQGPHRTDTVDKVRPVALFLCWKGLFLTGASLQLQKSSSTRILAIVLISLVSLAALIGIIAGFTYSGTSYHTPGMRRITMDDIFNGTFHAAKAQVNWVPEGMCTR